MTSRLARRIAASFLLASAFLFGRAAGQAPPAESGRFVRVRRSGGFAGLTADGQVDLDTDDLRAPELADLLDRIDLRAVAGGEPRPDMYVYAFDLCGDRATVPEQHLTSDLRRVAELVLDSGR